MIYCNVNILLDAFLALIKLFNSAYTRNKNNYKSAKKCSVTSTVSVQYEHYISWIDIVQNLPLKHS